MKYIMFSKVFPGYHPRKGEPTLFIEKIIAGLVELGFNDFGIKHRDYSGEAKWHTIRAGNRWKAGDKFSARFWKDKPYRSKQVEFAQIEVKKVFDVKIEIDEPDYVYVLLRTDKKDEYVMLRTLAVAKNDGLSYDDFKYWFKTGKPFRGQIICWSKDIKY